MAAFRNRRWFMVVALVVVLLMVVPAVLALDFTVSGNIASGPQYDLYSVPLVAGEHVAATVYCADPPIIRSTQSCRFSSPAVIRRAPATPTSTMTTADRSSVAVSTTRSWTSPRRWRAPTSSASMASASRPETIRSKSTPTGATRCWRMGGSMGSKPPRHPLLRRYDRQRLRRQRRAAFQSGKWRDRQRLRLDSWHRARRSDAGHRRVPGWQSLLLRL